MTQYRDLIRRIIPFAILLVTFIGNAQTYFSVSQSMKIQQNNYTYINLNSGLYSIADAIISSKKASLNQQKTLAQIEIVKTQYASQKSFPETIVDGWHIVFFTDNSNYYEEAKVLVENNEIQKFVIENYMPYSLNFKNITSIKNAKSLVSVEYASDNSDTVEVYFIYDLDQPSIVEKPMNPGYLTLWSPLKRAKSIKIMLDRKKYGNLLHYNESEPECGSPDEFTFKLKPGNYNLRALGRGKLDWKIKIEIKEDECLVFGLNKENKE